MAFVWLTIGFVGAVSFWLAILKVRNLRKRASSQELAKILTDAIALTSNYGAVLAKPHPGQLVRDTSELPATKDSMKAAITLCMAVEKDAYLLEAFKVGYLFLADFQNGVGNEPNWPEEPPAADAFNAWYARNKPTMDRLTHWLEIAERERQVLAADLTQRGLVDRDFETRSQKLATEAREHPAQFAGQLRQTAATFRESLVQRRAFERIAALGANASGPLDVG